MHLTGGRGCGVLAPLALGCVLEQDTVTKLPTVLEGRSCSFQHVLDVKPYLLTGDRRQAKHFYLAKQFLLLRRRLSSGGKPGQFSTFGREIPCETTAPGR